MLFNTFNFLKEGAFHFNSLRCEGDEGDLVSLNFAPPAHQQRSATLLQKV